MGDAQGITRPGVEGPKSIETVIARLPTARILRDFDSPQYWSKPDTQDVLLEQKAPTPAPPADKVPLACAVTVKATPVAEEHELYDLTNDPMELINQYDVPAYAAQQAAMEQMLADQRAKKRLSPLGGVVPGQ